MNLGVKTVLYGAHQFILHPLYVRRAWQRLYGPPRGVALHAAFIVHDLGYLTQNCVNLDDEAGEAHVLFGAGVMTALFGEEWGTFTRNHSRYWAQRSGQPVSRLCVADKLAPALMPAWLYLMQVILTGEVWEYVIAYHYGKYRREDTPEADIAHLHARRLNAHTARAILAWYASTMRFFRQYAEEHAAQATPEPGPQQSP